MLDESVTLAYRMNEGEAMRYKTEVVSLQTIKEDGKPAQQGQSLLEMTMLQTVKGVSPDGQMTVDVTIEKGTIDHGLDLNGSDLYCAKSSALKSSDWPTMRNCSAWKIAPFPCGNGKCLP